MGEQMTLGRVVMQQKDWHYFKALNILRVQPSWALSAALPCCFACFMKKQPHICIA